MQSRLRTGERQRKQHIPVCVIGVQPTQRQRPNIHSQKPSCPALIRCFLHQALQPQLRHCFRSAVSAHRISSGRRTDHCIRSSKSLGCRGLAQKVDGVAVEVCLGQAVELPFVHGALELRLPPVCSPPSAAPTQRNIKPRPGARPRTSANIAAYLLPSLRKF